MEPKDYFIFYVTVPGVGLVKLLNILVTITFHDSNGSTKKHRENSLCEQISFLLKAIGRTLGFLSTKHTDQLRNSDQRHTEIRGITLTIFKKYFIYVLKISKINYFEHL